MVGKTAVQGRRRAMCGTKSGGLIKLAAGFARKTLLEARQGPAAGVVQREVQQCSAGWVSPGQQPSRMRPVAKAAGRFMRREMMTARKGRIEYWHTKPSRMGTGLAAHCMEGSEGDETLNGETSQAAQRSRWAGTDMVHKFSCQCRHPRQACCALCSPF